MNQFSNYVPIQNIVLEESGIITLQENISSLLTISTEGDVNPTENITESVIITAT